MSDTNLLTTDQLRLKVERTWIEHIKLCQDNFLYFVMNVWPEFICRTDKDPNKWGHHQHIAHEFTSIAQNKKGRGGTSDLRGGGKKPIRVSTKPKK